DTPCTMVCAIVWFEPGERHWHGASPTTAMTHIAIADCFPCFWPHLGDNLTSCPSCFDVGQGLIGQFEREDPIHDRSDGSGVDQSRDLGQLTAVRSHEKKRVVHSIAFCLRSNPIAQEARDPVHDPRGADV